MFQIKCICMLWNLESYHFINNLINLDPSCKTSRILELFCLKPDEEETVALLSYSQINKVDSYDSPQNMFKKKIFD